MILRQWRHTKLPEQVTDLPSLQRVSGIAAAFEPIGLNHIARIQLTTLAKHAALDRSPDQCPDSEDRK
jgi:hypothetical protein